MACLVGWKTTSMENVFQKDEEISAQSNMVGWKLISMELHFPKLEEKKFCGEGRYFVFQWEWEEDI
nr:hypothetical protein Iba_chr11bCG12880 [Ipomoea batatas]